VIIKIVVDNKFDTPILYDGGGDRFWGVEYFKDDEWTNLAYKESGGFQLTEENIGDTCYITFYERVPLAELKPGSSLSNQWSQKICPFGTADPAEPRTVRYIESGRYRFTFVYGSGTTNNDSFRLSDSKTAYSNSFIIK